MIKQMLSCLPVFSKKQKQQVKKQLQIGKLSYRTRSREILLQLINDSFLLECLRFWEDSCCVDLLANMDHSLQGIIWFSMLPQDLQAEFFRVRCEMPNYKFPYTAIFICFHLFLFLASYFEGFGLVPPSCISFCLFF